MFKHSELIAFQNKLGLKPLSKNGFSIKVEIYNLL